ncbi:MAG: fibronectin type III domain-containing protein [Gemmatimonadaceae bacterium]
MGTWFLRARPTLPGAASQIAWSDPQQFTVITDLGGRTSAAASAVTLLSGIPDTVRERNITVTEREGWFAITARAGDSLFAETRAARLTPPSALNTTVSIFRQDGITELATGTAVGGTTDKRAVVVAPVAETFRVRVGGSGTTVGHYEVVLELRRLPAAPSALTAVATSGTSATLNWTDNADNESSFRIERCAGTGCTNFVEIASTNNDITTYADAGLTAGETYNYRVRARNTIGNSVYTATASLGLVGPAAPSVLTAVTTTPTAITLTWTDNANNESGFQIERCTGDGCTTFAQVGQVAANVTTFANTGLNTGEQFGYRVRAFNGVTQSAYSNTARAGTVAPAAPGTPSTQTLTATRIRVLWTDGINDELGFRVERCIGTACTDFAEVGVTASNATQFDDSTVVADAAYRYRVRAFNVVGLGAYSSIALGETRAPEPPAGLAATLAAGPRIDLVWTNPSPSATSFEVQRCVGALCSDFAPIDTVSVLSFSDLAIVTNTTYNYRVRSFNVVGASTFSGSATANTLLSTPPTGLTAVTRTATVIRLSWTDNAFDETGYRLDRCSGAGCSSFVTLATAPAASATYDDSTAVAGSQYSYRVSAVNLAGVSAPSNTASASTIVPAAPTGLTAATQSNTRIDLTWTDVATDESGYYIDRCSGAGCTNFATVDSVGANVATYQNTGLASNTTFVYRVRAFNGAGISTPSNTASAATNLPAIPTDLRGALVTVNRVDLFWTDAATDELGVTIERCVGTTCTDFAPIDTAAANATTFADVTALATTTYRYRIRAFNAVGNSDYSSIVRVTTAVPDAPAAVTAAALSTTRVRVNWNDASDNETAFIVERCTGAACVGFTGLDTLTGTLADTLSVIDSTVSAGLTYRYRVRATNALGSSTASNIAEVSTLIPATPTGLTATTISASQIDLVWLDAATSETAYEVERCVGAGCADFVRIIELPANSNAFSNTGLAANEVYRYRVRAVNGAGASAYSAIASAATDIPADPTNLVALPSSPTAVGLTWTDNANNETGYTVERCIGGSCSDFAVLQLLAPNVTSYNDGGLATGQSFRYRVQAVNVQGASRYSNIANAATVTPDTPIDLASKVISGTRIRLDWSDEASDELGYVIERCTGQSCTGFAVYDTVGANSTSFTDSLAVVGTYYRYQLYAYNNVGNSGIAGPIAANTVLPAPASALAGLVISSARIDLNWVDGSGNESGFLVERCAGAACSDFAFRDSLPSNTTFFSDLTVVLGTTYRYRVAPFNEAGTPGFVGPVTVGLALPATPVSLVADVVEPTSITVVWPNLATNEDGYSIERCVGAGCNSFSQIATTAPNDTTYTDVGLSGNTFYRYRVRAFNAAGTSEYSPVAAPNTFLPGPPTTLIAIPRFANRIDLSWTDNASNEIGFRIERCTGSACADFAVIDTIAANAISYVDSSLTFNTAYRYRVNAFNGVGGSTFTNIVGASTDVPLAPTALVATAQGQNTVNLTYTDNASNESGFRFERCTGATCTNFVLIDSVGANAATFNDNTVLPGNVYRYRMLAYNIGASGYSNADSATTVLPVAPTTLVATAASSNRIDLTWLDNADNEAGYRIERCEGAACSSFTLLVNAAANNGSYSDSSLTTGTAYSYRVRAFNDAGISAFTNVASSVPNVPAIPTALLATTISASRIDLAWVDNATNESGYLVERCVGPGCTDFTSRATLAAGVTTYQDVGLTASTSFRYRVRAVGASGNSAPSNIAAASTNPPADPANLVATTISGTRLELSWADNADNEATYELERCIGASCTDFGALVSLPANTVAYSDATVVIDTRYRYRLRATNNAGVSAYSAIADGSTLRPTVPTAFTALTTSSSSVRLTWTDASDNESVFVLERCTGAACTDFALVDSIAAGGTQYDDVGLATATTFRYRLFAANVAGQSTVAGPVTASTNLPADPSAAAATVVSGSRIDVTWTDNSANETFFRIERCVGAGCSSFAVLDSVVANLTVFSDLTIGTGEYYSYRVRSVNAAGASNPSDPATTNTILPAEPAKLALALTRTTEVSMIWSDGSDNETGFSIERCAGVGCTNFAAIALAVADTQFYRDTTVTLGETYTYRLRAVNAAGGSPYLPERTITATAPTAPSSLTASILSASQARLTWIDNSNSEVGFYVDRCTGLGCSDFAVIDSTLTNDRSYQASGLVSGSSYTFRIRAFNAAGASAATNLATTNIVTPAAPSNPAAVTNSPTSATITWLDNANNETSYRVERCTGVDCTNFLQIASVAVNTVSYADGGITLNNVYNYRIRAVNAVGPSAYTSVVTATTLAPAAPTNPLATPITGQRIDVSWTDASDNENGFEVESCLGVACTEFAPLATVAANVTTFAATVANNSTYRFRVRAVRTVIGPSAYSAIVQASTVLNAPTLPAATVYDRSRIDITWADNSTLETGYEILACAGVSCTPNVLLATRPANSTSYSHVGLNSSPGVSLTYQVRAITTGAASAYTSAVTQIIPPILESAVSRVIAGASGSQNHYVITVPAGTPELRVTITGGTGDADIYVRSALAANFSTFDCFLNIGGNEETCSIQNPVAGDWYVMVYGFNAYATVTLRASNAIRQGFPNQFPGSLEWSSGFLLAQQITTTTPVTLTHLGMRVATPAAGSVKLGLYTNRLRFVGTFPNITFINEPGELITQATGTMVAGTAEYLSGNTTVAAGTYWLAMVFSNNSTIFADNTTPVTWKYYSWPFANALPTSFYANTMFDFTTGRQNLFIRGVP